MPNEVVRVRVVAASAEAARAAVKQLRLAGADLGEPEQGRKGDWLAYGEIVVEVEQAAAAAPRPLRRRPRRW